MVLDQDCRILRWTEGTARLFGYTAKDALGKLSHELLRTSFPMPLEQILSDLRRDCQWRGELIHRCIRGEERIVATLWILRDIGPEPVILSISNDITERKRAENELAQSEQRLQATFDNAGVGIVELDADDHFIVVNDRMCQILGYQRHELLGKSILEVVQPEDQADIKSIHAQLHDGSRRRVRYQRRHLKRDGTVIWAQITVATVRDAQGKFLRAVAVIEDVTAMKQAQEEIIAAKAAAEAASHAKDHFLAVLSHELRTPLTPVVATLSLMEERKDLDPATRESLEMITRNVNLEARLIDDLLDITRIARGKVELERRPIPLLDIIKQATEVVRPDIEARNLQFAVDVEPGNYIVNADRTRLQQVFWNLLRNAAKFTAHGGRVWVKVGPGGDPGSAEGPRTVVVEVHDNGEGMSPGALHRIFNAFEQAERSITRQFGGLGLGLTISKALVEMHGGTIWASSEGKGLGSTFYVQLPLEPVALQPLPRETPPDQPRTAIAPRPPVHRRGLRILLVEDHGDTALVMSQLLSRNGHRVERAGDVVTALELAGRSEFDLLISDLGLPDGSGLDLIQTLRARGKTMPAIALSGYGQERDIERSREAGFAHHIVKPITASHLAETINALFAEKA